ncbi:hypothetical protein [Acidovorax sp. SRB_14]|uniref:hypothetical protein n=1 Tax=Acidovorax sp. SRB_14 TaxID=1962699 RepID=UPI001C203725|nr:hypothetical protein [Acidovorax sp. SRB_14]
MLKISVSTADIGPLLPFELHRHMSAVQRLLSAEFVDWIHDICHKAVSGMRRVWSIHVWPDVAPVFPAPPYSQ